MGVIQIHFLGNLSQEIQENFDKVISNLSKSQDIEVVYLEIKDNFELINQ